MPRRTQRSAFSLLEMVLALALGMLLLLALYLTLNMHVRQIQGGRQTLAEANTARYIFTRISNDIVSQLGPIDPRVLPDYSATASAASAAAAASSAQSSTTPPATTPTTPMVTEVSTVAFNVGVRGDASSLTLSVYRVQPPARGKDGAANDTAPISDLRRITYWLVMNGENATGLARQEIAQATGNDIDNLPTGGPDQEKFVIAPEVKGVIFEYFDGTSWSPTWDGTAPGGIDGDTPIGPPAAIRITLKLRSGNRSPGSEDQGTEYQYVVALPAGNNFPQATTTP